MMRCYCLVLDTGRVHKWGSRGFLVQLPYLGIRAGFFHISALWDLLMPLPFGWIGWEAGGGRVGDCVVMRNVGFHDGYSVLCLLIQWLRILQLFG